MHLADLQVIHIRRQDIWCPDQKPDLSFRGNELAGEVGEAIDVGKLLDLAIITGRTNNIIKKIERERQGWKGSRATKEQLADELGDVIHAAILVAITAGIDIEKACIDKFNKTSEQNEIPLFITENGDAVSSK